MKMTHAQTKFQLLYLSTTYRSRCRPSGGQRSQDHRRVGAHGLSASTQVTAAVWRVGGAGHLLGEFRAQGLRFRVEGLGTFLEAWSAGHLVAVAVWSTRAP